MTTRAHRVGRRTTLGTLLVTIWLGWAAGCQDDKLLVPLPQSTTGSLLVTLITTGNNQDPDGYHLIVDQGTPIKVSTSTEVSLSLTAGPHTIALADVAANCSVTGGNPRLVTLSASGTAAVTFQVACPFFGALTVSTSTSGTSVDSDGYVLNINGAPRGPLGPQEVLGIGALPPAIYVLRLSSVAGNCSIAQGASRFVNVTEDKTETVHFAVTCGPRIDDAPGEKLVVAVRSSSVDDNDLYFMEPDGRSQQRLTDHVGDELSPEISPDGDRILFLHFGAAGRSLRVLNRVTRTETVLPTTGVDRAIWSPDGNSIAFIRGGRLFRMNADGTGEVPLTSGPEDAAPYWSPDGTRIVFARRKQVYMVNANGSGLRLLSNLQRTSGPWSPDGRSIVISKIEDICDWYCYYYGPIVAITDLVILDIEAGTERLLTQTPQLTEWSPVWAPDGRRVYYLSAVAGTPDVYVIGLDGGAAVNLSASAAAENWITIGRLGHAASGVRSSASR